MKHNITSKGGLALIMMSLIWIASISIGLTQTATNIVVAQFDTDTTGNFHNEFGVGTTYAWDTNNAITVIGPNSPGSGSVHMVYPWTSTGQQNSMHYSLPSVVNLNNFTNISFDFMVDSNSVTDGNGSYGAILVGFATGAGGGSGLGTFFGTLNALVSNGSNVWYHVSFPINPNNGNYANCGGIGFKLQQNRSGFNLADGNSSFHVDNIILQAKQTPPPIPVMSITKQTPNLPAGLLMFPAEQGGDSSRQLLETVGTQFSWIGSGATPITYSTTIASFPASSPAFQGAIFLVAPGTSGDPGVDYDAATVAQLSVIENGDGTATGLFQYKINLNNASPNITLASLTVPSAVGTWSITFNNDTNVTLSGPGGVSTNAFFQDDATALNFANPMRLYYGCQQGGSANTNAYAIFSEFKVSGVTASTAFDDTFSETSLDTTNTWIRDGVASGNMIIIQPSTTPEYWVGWSLPAVGYGLQAASNINSFSDAGVINSVTTPSKTLVLVPNMATTVAANQAFFNVIHRSFTQLQVLLPGETNAPGTATGKIGTPTPVSFAASSGAENVTVNAVDSTYHIISGVSDTVQITTTDSSAFTPLNSNLVNGTETISGLVFESQGSWTVTATDLSNGGITAGTSSSVTVGP